jgi:hypothetical protein
MHNLLKTGCLALFAWCVIAPNAQAQAVQDSANRQEAARALPLKRIVILASGMAYYEHTGNLSGAAQFSLSFKPDAINDALKSLVINDPASKNPSVRYQSEQTLLQTLRSLKIDLSGRPDIAEILRSQRGAEVEIAAPTPASGRIVGVETRVSVAPNGETKDEAWLSLYTAGGLRLFNIKEINTFTFKDAGLNQDLSRALDLISAVRNSVSRDLQITLDGTGERRVSLSYVIPAPVWKVSYRLDLGSITPPAGNNAAKRAALFQGWAIVDNDTDADWNNVELSLVAGRPVSFIQSLYPPYYVSRPILPLAIAGAAPAETHDSGFGFSAENETTMKSVTRNRGMALREADAMMAYEEAEDERAYPSAAAPAPSVAGGAMQTAQGAAAGDQFEFTIKNPVSLDRRMSAMLPLVEQDLEGRKLVIFSGANAPNRSAHPRLGAELVNSSGMKLPAGPITVYDGGVYAGDALIEFWNENEKRLISFGEDLSVTASVSETTTRSISAVKIAGGVMNITSGLTYFKTYTFKNSGGQSKSLLIEHPKTYGASLVSPEADEETAAAYRFTMTLPAGRELVITVSEERPIEERVTLFALRPEAFVRYVSNQEIPATVRAALQQAVELRRKISAEEAAASELEERRQYLISEQERIRENFQAVGGETQLGQDYLKRLTALDSEMDGLAPRLEQARAGVKAAQKAYEDYLNGLTL